MPDQYREAIELEIKIVANLLDNFEYFKTGLCALSREDMVVDNIDVYLWHATLAWIDTSVPDYTYGGYFNTWDNVYSWPRGKADLRWYWLKDRLKELRFHLEVYTT